MPDDLPLPASADASISGAGVEPARQSEQAARADSAFCAQVEQILRNELGARAAQLQGIAPEAAAAVSTLEEFLVGGKMLRPRLCFWGGRAALEGEPSPEAVRALARAGAAIELVQASALLHDDVIDRSASRRGRPAVHIALARAHRDQGLAGDAERFGEAMAIVLGDLALAWAYDLMAALPAGREEFSALCTEVMAGQHLDILHQAGGFRSPASEEDAAREVVRWKTVPYTTLRPVRLGASLIGADEDLLDALSDWAIDIGTAFQLRDDLLSVVGDEDVTGKPTGGDVREGKRTALLARTRRAAGEDGRALLDGVVGQDGASARDVAAVQELMVRTGAVEEVAAEVRALAARADSVLAGRPSLPPLAREGLRRIARAATDVENLSAQR